MKDGSLIPSLVVRIFVFANGRISSNFPTQNTIFGVILPLKFFKHCNVWIRCPPVTRQPLQSSVFTLIVSTRCITRIIFIHIVSFLGLPEFLWFLQYRFLFNRPDIIQNLLIVPSSNYHQYSGVEVDVTGRKPANAQIYSHM